MLDAFWHLRGSVRLAAASSDEAVLDEIEALLNEQDKTLSDRELGSLAFDDPLWTSFGGRNWQAMVIYDRGRFWLEHGLQGRRLRYELRSLHGMVFCLFAALVGFIFGVAGEGLSKGVTLGMIAFAWLYGMNVLLAYMRVSGAIHHAVARADPHSRSHRAPN
jgi:hypothetical protein